MEETRNQVIARLIDEHIRVSAVSWETYSQAVVDHYHTQVPDVRRGIKFHAGGDAYKDMRANAQIIKRIVHDEVRMPVELEESLVEALPVEWNQRCKKELANRFGLLAARIPDPEHRTDVQGISGLLRESADVMDAIAPMLADGVIDENDMPLAKRALQEINDLDAVLATLRKQITDILPDADNVLPIHGGVQS
ncbi:MAG: hypothetical protein SV201_05780 [Pseudomonadota bacterium]|nr:hypothetical protein [Pseudomonadota bacterium]